MPFDYMSSSPVMNYMRNCYNSYNPPPLDLLVGLQVMFHEPELFDPGDPGPVPHPFVPPSAFDTQNIQALNALKARVQMLADISSELFSQNSQLGFDPGPASSDSASPASPSSIYDLASPTSSMLSGMSASGTSSEGLLPSPTSSTFPWGSPASSFSSGPSSAYSPQEYHSQPSHALSLPPSAYQEGHGTFLTSAPSFGTAPSAFALPPLAMSSEPAALSATRPPAPPNIPPVFPGYPEPRADPLLPHLLPHIDATQNGLPAPTPFQAICEICGQGMVLLWLYYAVAQLRSLLIIAFYQVLRTRKT